MFDKFARNKWTWVLFLLVAVGYLRSDINKHDSLWIAIDGGMALLSLLMLLVCSSMERRKDA